MFFHNQEIQILELVPSSIFHTTSLDLLPSVVMAIDTYS